jgi:hypothetical protein
MNGTVLRDKHGGWEGIGGEDSDVVAARKLWASSWQWRPVLQLTTGMGQPTDRSRSLWIVQVEPNIDCRG